MKVNIGVLAFIFYWLVVGAIFVTYTHEVRPVAAKQLPMFSVPAYSSAYVYGTDPESKLMPDIVFLAHYYDGCLPANRQLLDNTYTLAMRFPNGHRHVVMFSCDQSHHIRASIDGAAPKTLPMNEVPKQKAREVVPTPFYRTEKLVSGLGISRARCLNNDAHLYDSFSMYAQMRDGRHVVNFSCDELRHVRVSIDGTTPLSLP